MADFTVTLSEQVAPTARRAFVDANTNLTLQQTFSRTLTSTIGGATATDHSPPIPTFPEIEWPTGTALFEVNWKTLSQSISGSGVLEPTHLKLSGSATDMGVDINAGTLFYEGSEYQLNSDTTITLPAGDGTHDRWDTVYYDITQEEVRSRSGEASLTPTPPQTKGEEILLGTVKVTQGATDIGDDDIHNWRTSSPSAGNLSLDDADGHYSAATVEAALDEAVDKFLDAAGDALEGPLDLSNFSGSAPLDLDVNPGQFGDLVDASIDATSAQGTEHSFSLSIDGNAFLKMYAESDGSGSIQNVRVEVKQETKFEDVVDFNYQRVKNFIAEKVASDPPAGNPGRIVFNTTDRELKVDKGDSFGLPKSEFDPDVIRTDESGTVGVGEAGVMHVRGLDPGEKLEIHHAALMLADGQAAPNGLDMTLCRFDNAGNVIRRTDVINGDGTVQDDVTGDPIATFENSSGTETTVGILIDNGKFPGLGGTGSEQDIQATATGKVVKPLSVTMDETMGGTDETSQTKS